MSIFVILGLLVCIEAQGSSAVTTVFVKKGDDLILNVDDVPDEFFLVDWTFNEMVSVVRFRPGREPIIFPRFTGRLEFPVKNVSVKLKNLQEADSGVYAARVVTIQGGVQPLAEYKVTVQGPVSPVELTVDSVDSVVSRSSDSCNLTVSCSTQHSHISSTFRCVNRTCSQEGGERSEPTTSGASLHVYLVNSSIICNHSNQVTEDFKRIEPFCPQYAGSSAVTTVFVQKGDDLILNVDADVPEKFLFVEWNFNDTVAVVVFIPDEEPTVDHDFTGRVEFPVKKFSVKLKNLQEADSGVYAARVFMLRGEKPLAEYKVTVQGPVSPVELTVDSVDSRSSDSCNLTVTCSTQHSHISSTFRCVNRTCSQEGGERPELTTSGASLHVYLVNSSIICNHSNQVTEDFKRIEPFCPQYAGSSAVTTVFVKKGDDLILNVDADVPEKFLFVDWNFNDTVAVVVFIPDEEPTVDHDFTGRVEFPVKKFSVKLKNLQEADSGVYAARVFMLRGEKPLAEYKVTVQGPVSPVELTVDSVDSRSSDSCNLNVTCSTQHSHISSTFRCVNRTCSQEGGERSELTTSGASLHVYLVNSSIICNHSNQVTEDFKRIEPFCPQYAGSEGSSAGTSVYLVKMVVFSVGLIIMVSAVITVHLMEKFRKHK